MVVGKITRVANGKRRALAPRRRTAVVPKKSAARNPAHMLTLGYLNPKRRPQHAMAKTKKRKYVHRATSNARRHHKAHRSHRRRSNPHRTVVIRSNKKHHVRHKRHRNPSFFGTQATPMKMATYIAGGLIGVTINRAILPMLPSSVTSNNFFSTLAAFGLALVEWWAGNMISKDFGSAVGFGALMNAGSTALNTFIPQVGSAVSLSGVRRRGTGDFVGAQWTIPDTSVNAMSAPGMGAYRPAYGG